MKEPKEEISYPAGRKAWAWEWMGFKAPNLCYSNEPLDPKYNDFCYCFDAYYGIGDFDFWMREPLNALSEDDAVRLVNCLIEDNQRLTVVRDYLGLLPDGSINKAIDPYAHGRYYFFKHLPLDVCTARRFPHNQRTRYEDRYYCSDCDNWFTKDNALIE